MFASRKFMFYFLSLPAYYCQRFISIYTHECVDLLSLFWPQNCHSHSSPIFPASLHSLERLIASALYSSGGSLQGPSFLAILNATAKKWVLGFANTAHVNKTVCKHFKFNSVRVLPLPFWRTWPSIVKIYVSILPLAYYKTGNSFLQPRCETEVVISFCI